jgi:hypothetical protein
MEHRSVWLSIGFYSYPLIGFGKTQMAHYIYINIADLPIKIYCPDNIFLAKIKSIFLNFIDKKETVPSFEFRFEIINKFKEINHLSKNRDSEVIDLKIEFEDKIAFLQLDPSTKVSHCYIPQEAYDSILDSIFELLISFVLVLNKGINLHATSIIKDNKGYVFFGPSGAGKSTIANSALPFALHDERTIIRLVNNKFRVYNSPFKYRINKKVMNKSAEIASVFHIIKSRNNKIKKEPISKMIRAFEKQVIFLKMIDNLGKKDMLQKNIHKLFKNKSNYSLYFRKKCDFWSIINEIE